MEMQPVLLSTSDTIRLTAIAMAEEESCLLALEKGLFFAPLRETLSLFGESFEMPADSRELTARRSATRESYAAQNSFVKRMRLLMKSGLVRGIIPMSMRKKSGAGTQDIVSSVLVGGAVEKQKVDL